MKIGTVKEVKTHEYRVGMTPGNVRDYIEHGHEVYVQAGAGEGSFLMDEEYVAAGAKILSTAKEIWDTCEMVVKVKEPLAQEYDLMREDQIIYTYLHLAADRTLTEKLVERKCKAVAYETIYDKSGGLPLLQPMSEVAGKLSIQVGARHLERPQGGRGVLLGGVVGVSKAKVLILGGGVVGTAAMKMAIGLGASVIIMDNNISRLTYLDDVFGNEIQTMYSTASAIEVALANADLVIGAVLIPGGAAPKLIKKSHLKNMKRGSVIVDVAVDQGGCCETSRPTYHDNPTFVEDGVIHYCVGNMPGAVSQTSTFALTNATLSYGLKIASQGLENASKADKGLLAGINVYKGQITCEEVARVFNMPYTKLDF
ncbi:MAG: alanine dehydrogenase [Defluviitaleaceae bacterium]|nr:alanine dehydrogenase [Defluviitaleaceae bacterium]